MAQGALHLVSIADHFQKPGRFHIAGQIILKFSHALGGRACCGQVPIQPLDGSTIQASGFNHHGLALALVPKSGGQGKIAAHFDHFPREVLDCCPQLCVTEVVEHFMPVVDRGEVPKRQVEVWLELILFPAGNGGCNDLVDLQINEKRRSGAFNEPRRHAVGEKDACKLAAHPFVVHFWARGGSSCVRGSCRCEHGHVSVLQLETGSMSQLAVRTSLSVRAGSITTYFIISREPPHGPKKIFDWCLVCRCTGADHGK